MADAEVVTLLIRSPSSKQDEKEVKAPRSFSVRELKSQLRRELPGHPAEQDQRLIYAGKLLPDHLKLDEVLSKETRHVMHLVCSMKSTLQQQQSQGQESKQPPVGTSNTPNNGAPQAEGIRQRIVPQNVPAAQPSTPRPQDVNPAFSPFSVYSPQQIMWLQQMYARQYYMQYYAAAAATSSPSQRRQEIPVVPPAAPDPLPHPFPAANQAPNPEVQAPINPGANQNLRMNAQGGLVEEEDDINRDWLDWVYTAARFSIFLSILYFYSSLSRFMMVLGAMILMYLHTAGWFPFRQRRPPVAAVPAPPAVPNQQDQNNNLQQDNDHGGAHAHDTAATDQTHSFTSTAWVFFKTFFASLIPEGPQAMAQ